MKKTIYILSILLISAGSLYAQKSNVKLAKSRSNAIENPDFNGAREAIRLALQDPTTKDLADTWEVAGNIGYLQFQYMQQQKFINGVEPDQAELGKAVAESYKYFVVADSLSLIPNAKGKVSERMHKALAAKMLEYYKSQALIMSGIQSFNDNKDYDGAYEYFDMHLNIPDLTMMQDPKLQEQMPKDTDYLAYRSYQASFAINGGHDDKAIAIYESMKDGAYKPVAIREWLANEYNKVGDTVNYVRTLNESIEKFPEEPYFIQVLINHYINTNQVDAALTYLDKAIERNPNVANYYQIKGNIYAFLYERDGTHRDDALKTLNKALELDDKLPDVYYSLGNVYYVQAEKVREHAGYQQDNRLYEQEMNQANEIFAKALPYFEQANSLKNDDRTTKLRLRSIYRILKMQDKYDAMDAEIRNM